MTSDNLLLALSIPVLWMAASLPGLILWLANSRSSRRTLQAVKVSGVGNGRLLWAVYQARATSTQVAVESIFVASGLAAFLANLGLVPYLPYRITVSVLLIIASALMTFLALQRRRNDEELQTLALARLRQGEEMDRRGRAQDLRTIAQDERERSLRQAARGNAQDERGAEQDAHDAHPLDG